VLALLRRKVGLGEALRWLSPNRLLPQLFLDESGVRS
jgi:hypothetical protein